MNYKEIDDYWWRRLQGNKTLAYWWHFKWILLTKGEQCMFPTTMECCNAIVRCFSTSDLTSSENYFFGKGKRMHYKSSECVIYRSVMKSVMSFPGPHHMTWIAMKKFILFPFLQKGSCIQYLQWWELQQRTVICEEENSENYKSNAQERTEEDQSKR